MSGPGTPERDPESGRPGSVLRAEREALGVTVREVAETLNLSVATIEAIEADDLARLPGPVFARGYVRAYARLLDLEPQALMAQYPEVSESVEVSDAPSPPQLLIWLKRRPLVVLAAGGVAALLLLLLLVMALWPESTPQTAPRERAAAETAGAGAEPGGGDDVETVTRPMVDAAPDLEPPPGAEVEDTAAELGDTAGAAESVDAAPPAAEGAEPEARRITDIGDDRLAFVFGDDCWVEVRSSSGATLYSDLNRGGSELRLIGRGPFRILLGYAPGVRLAFNGEPVPLAPYTRDNVATLVLGQ